VQGVPGCPSCAYGASPCCLPRTGSPRLPTPALVYVRFVAFPLTRCSYTLQCGKSRTTLAPRRQATKAPPATTNHPKPTRKRRATTTKVVKPPKVAEEKPTSKVSFLLIC
jgi:hypothetical protein